MNNESEFRRLEDVGIAFTDIVHSTALLRSLGDEPAAELFAAHDRTTRRLLRLHGGIEVDKSDGFFALFASAADAGRFGLDYLEMLVSLGPFYGVHLRARVGIHVGPLQVHANGKDVVALGARPLEVEGLAKPIAARVMGSAEPGQILLSWPAVRQILRSCPTGSATQFSCRHTEVVTMRGLGSPMELFDLKRAAATQAIAKAG